MSEEIKITRAKELIKEAEDEISSIIRAVELRLNTEITDLKYVGQNSSGIHSYTKLLVEL